MSQTNYEVSLFLEHFKVGYQNLPDEPFLAVLYPPYNTKMVNVTITNIKTGDSSSSAMLEKVVVKISLSALSGCTGVPITSTVTFSLAGPGGKSAYGNSAYATPLAGTTIVTCFCE